MSKQAAHQGRPAEAVTLAETALVGVRSHRTPRLLAQLHIRRAYASATLRDRSACTGDLESSCPDRAARLRRRPPWLYWVVPAWITVEAGDCLLRMDQADRAAAMLHEGIAMFDESFVRDRQLYTLHRADALTRPGKQQDLDDAAGLGMASIDLAASLDPTLGADLLLDLCHRMAPHAKVPAVRDFLEQAKGVLPGS